MLFALTVAEVVIAAASASGLVLYRTCFKYCSSLQNPTKCITWEGQ